MTLYPGQPGWAWTVRNTTSTVRNINPIYQLHCPQIRRKHAQPSFPVSLYRPPIIPQCNTRENAGKQLKGTWIIRGQEPTFVLLYTRLILDLMRSLVNHWSPLTHTSHCMTTSRTSRSAAVTQMRASVSTAMHLNVFTPDVLPTATFPFPFPIFGTEKGRQTANISLD